MFEIPVHLEINFSSSGPSKPLQNKSSFLSNLILVHDDSIFCLCVCACRNSWRYIIGVMQVFILANFPQLNIVKKVFE